MGGNNLDHDFEIEYNEVWNLNIEHPIASGTVFSAAYIGSRTVHADSATVLNVPVPGPGAIAARRPIPQLSQFNTIRWDGWATYHALTLKVERRMARGLMFNANWTWSHSIDDASDPGPTLNETNLPQDVRNMAAEKADSSFDHRHRFVVSFVYDLPLTRATSGWKSSLLGNWRASGNFAAQSGAPFTVNIASDRANIGAGPAQRPNMNGDPNNGTAHAGAVVRYVGVFACPRSSHSAMRREMRWWVRDCTNSIWRCRRKCTLTETREAAVPCRSVQPLQPSELQYSQSHGVHGELRQHLQRAGRAPVSVCRAARFLNRRASRTRTGLPAVAASRTSRNWR